MTEKEFDIVVIGGGIGGSAFATVMARAGHSVLLLEKTSDHVDKVRGEWMAPWGVKELQTLDLYEPMMAAGGHHISRAVGFDEDVDVENALADFAPVDDILPGVLGPLCLGHPTMCNVLNTEAEKAGVRVLREVSKIEVAPGAPPQVSYSHGGTKHTLQPRLIIGADGRAGMVAKQIGVKLHSDPVKHFFSGMLVEGLEGLPIDQQWIGTEGDVHYFCFPQSPTRARLYLGISPDTPSRFSGTEGPRKFLDAFNLRSMPYGDSFANAVPAGPCHAYPNSDTWVADPYRQGVVLIGDAAGHNDPINGQGLSVTLRDVRVLRDLLLASDEWGIALFAQYGDERMERMRRLRFMARVTVELFSIFSDDGRRRRTEYRARAKADPQTRSVWLGGTLMAGPELMPEEAFTQTSWEWFVGPEVPFPAESLSQVTP
ncbi:MAG: FAD-dependent monooxygenase [Alphaproteobacteria bacterium]|nr:MAG: FAD-dependent monooxygenase [Alphaproteobacteria bacterium]